MLGTTIHFHRAPAEQQAAHAWCQQQLPQHDEHPHADADVLMGCTGAGQVETQQGLSTAQTVQHQHALALIT